MRPLDLAKLGEDTRARLRNWKPGINIFSVLSESDFERMDADEGISAKMLYTLAANLKREERKARKFKNRYWSNPEKWRARSRNYWRQKQQLKNHEQLAIAKNLLSK